MSSVKNERENPFQALSNSSINKPLSGDSKKRRKRRSKKKENEQESVEKVCPCVLVYVFFFKND